MEQKWLAGPISRRTVSANLTPATTEHSENTTMKDTLDTT